MSLPGGYGTERSLWSPAMSKATVQNTAAVQNLGRPTAAGMSEVVWGSHLWEKSGGRWWPEGGTASSQRKAVARTGQCRSIGCPETKVEDSIFTAQSLGSHLGAHTDSSVLVSQGCGDPCPLTHPLLTLSCCFHDAGCGLGMMGKEHSCLLLLLSQLFLQLATVGIRD